MSVATSVAKLYYSCVGAAASRFASRKSWLDGDVGGLPGVLPIPPRQRLLREPFCRFGRPCSNPVPKCRLAGPGRSAPCLADAPPGHGQPSRQPPPSSSLQRLGALGMALSASDSPSLKFDPRRIPVVRRDLGPPPVPPERLRPDWLKAHHGISPPGSPSKARTCARSTGARHASSAGAHRGPRRAHHLAAAAGGASQASPRPDQLPRRRHEPN